MASIAADILSTFSGPSGDSGVQTARETTASSSIGDRKRFSSVLQTARGEAERTPILNADDARSVNMTDDGTHAEETEGLNDSTRPEQSHASSQTTEGARPGSKEDTFAGDVWTGVESSTRQNDGEADPQDQGPVSIASLISAHAQPQVVDRTEVQTETEPPLIGDEAGSERKSHHPLISHEPIESFSTPPETIGGRSSLSHVGTVSDFSSTQRSNPAEPRTNDDESGVQDAERETAEGIKDSGRVATDRGSSVPVSQDSIPRSPQDPNIPRHVVQAHVGKTSLDGNVIVADDKAANHGGRSGDYSVSSQAATPVQSLGDQDALDASTEQSLSHGRQPGKDGPEQLSELWSRHNGRQMETAEPKISQPFVVDHTIANGSVALGASSQAISVPGTPAPTPVVTPVQPGLPAEEMAQPTGIPGMRSVVVNVVQPDLGHVNIRVAMTNDMVHTHFSPDRLEVGQFFINGQDRLQAALQASGLDLGQFRVDIDRQSGGRSFQQGSPQEQGQSWSQGSHGTEGEHAADQRGEIRMPIQGILNVMA